MYFFASAVSHGTIANIECLIWSVFEACGMTCNFFYWVTFSSFQAGGPEKETIKEGAFYGGESVGKAVGAVG